MARDFLFLWKIFVHSLWQRDHHSSKQKVKTIDIQNICSSVDYDYKDGGFSTLTEVNFSKFFTDLFEKPYPPLVYQTAAERLLPLQNYFLQ